MFQNWFAATPSFQKIAWNSETHDFCLLHFEDHFSHPVQARRLGLKFTFYAWTCPLPLKQISDRTWPGIQLQTIQSNIASLSKLLPYQAKKKKHFPPKSHPFKKIKKKSPWCFLLAGERVFFRSRTPDDSYESLGRFVKRAGPFCVMWISVPIKDSRSLGRVEDLRGESFGVELWIEKWRYLY